MPSITFEYGAIPFRDPKTGEIRQIFKPFIPIKLCRGGRIYEHLFLCLVDSGSDINLFPAEVGNMIGIRKIRKGKPMEIEGINKNADMVIGYKHEVDIYLGPRKFSTKIYFSEGVSTCILGRIGFFNLFEGVRFREGKNVVELELKED